MYRESGTLQTRYTSLWTTVSLPYYNMTTSHQESSCFLSYNGVEIYCLLDFEQQPIKDKKYI